ncbi:MAG: hypothetical protein AAFX99_13930 [Myxococcota bacterium]
MKSPTYTIPQWPLYCLMALALTLLGLTYLLMLSAVTFSLHPTETKRALSALTRDLRAIEQCPKPKADCLHHIRHWLQSPPTVSRTSRQPWLRPHLGPIAQELDHQSAALLPANGPWPVAPQVSAGPASTDEPLLNPSLRRQPWRRRRQQHQQTVVVGTLASRSIWATQPAGHDPLRPSTCTTPHPSPRVLDGQPSLALAMSPQHIWLRALPPEKDVP